MNPYRSSAKPTKKADPQFLQFAVELEEARIAAVYEHLRIFAAGFVAFLNGVSWLAGGLEMFLLTAHQWGVVASCTTLLVWVFGFYIMAVYSFHTAYRLLGGRLAEWPRLRTVAR